MITNNGHLLFKTTKLFTCSYILYQVNYIVMKKIPLTLIFIVFIALSCGNAVSSASGKGDSYTQSEIMGTWELIRFEDTSRKMVRTPPEDSKTPITITFTGHKIEGNTAANSFAGDYSLSSGQLTIENLSTTLVAESRWGDRFLKAFTNGTMTFSVEGDALKMEYEDSKFMYFKKR